MLVCQIAEAEEDLRTAFRETAVLPKVSMDAGSVRNSRVTGDSSRMVKIPPLEESVSDRSTRCRSWVQKNTFGAWVRDSVIQ